MKRAILKINDFVLLDLLKDLQFNDGSQFFWRIKENPLPNDVKPIRIMNGYNPNIIEIILESDEFENIEDGEMYPEISLPVIQKVYRDSITLYKGRYKDIRKRIIRRYICPACQHDTILDNFNYCPGCGYIINWEELKTEEPQ